MDWSICRRRRARWLCRLAVSLPAVLPSCGGVLRHVEDVVDDLEGETGFFPEGAEAGDGVGALFARGSFHRLFPELCVLFGGGVARDGEGGLLCVRATEEAPGDDGGCDKGAGLRAVDALDQLGGGLVLLRFRCP